MVAKRTCYPSIGEERSNIGRRTGKSGCVGERGASGPVSGPAPARLAGSVALMTRVEQHFRTLLTTPHGGGRFRGRPHDVAGTARSHETAWTVCRDAPGGSVRNAPVRCDPANRRKHPDAGPASAYRTFRAPCLRPPPGPPVAAARVRAAATGAAAPNRCRVRSAWRARRRGRAPSGPARPCGSGPSPASPRCTRRRGRTPGTAPATAAAAGPATRSHRRSRTACW